MFGLLIPYHPRRSLTHRESEFRSSDKLETAGYLIQSDHRYMHQRGDISSQRGVECIR